MRAIGQFLLSTPIVSAIVTASLALAACQSVGQSVGQSVDKRDAVDASSAPDSPAAFLEQNARAEGIKTLPGIQYRILRSGPADGAHPKRSDNVTVHYEGKLVSGEVFDSSYQRGEPVTFPLRPLIPGWVIALQLMRPGDEWLIYVPPEMAYGAQATGPIPANSVLIFRVELISFEPAPKEASKQ